MLTGHAKTFVIDMLRGIGSSYDSLATTMSQRSETAEQTRALLWEWAYISLVSTVAQRKIKTGVK